MSNENFQSALQQQLNYSSEYYAYQLRNAHMASLSYIRNLSNQRVPNASMWNIISTVNNTNVKEGREKKLKKTGALEIRYENTEDYCIKVEETSYSRDQRYRWEIYKGKNWEDYYDRVDYGFGRTSDEAIYKAQRKIEQLLKKKNKKEFQVPRILRNLGL